MSRDDAQEERMASSLDIPRCFLLHDKQRAMCPDDAIRFSKASPGHIALCF
jgi:hypothetical protein